MIRELSFDRYKQADEIQDVEGIWLSPNTPILDTSEKYDDVFHTVQETDRLDLLAYEFLGDSRLWWVIATYNNIFWMFDIKVGQLLRIPSYEHLQLDLIK